MIRCLIYSILFLIGCTSNQLITLYIEPPSVTFIQNKLDEAKDTVYSGKVIFSFQYVDDEMTFISTDSLNVIVLGLYELYGGDSIFVVYPDTNRDRTKATIIWEKDRSEHKIKRKVI